MNKNKEIKRRPAWINFVTGGAAALSGWLLVHPFDLIKVRSQLYGKKSSFLSVGRSVVNQNGFRGLYGGLEAAVVRQLTYGNLRLGLYSTIADLFKRKKHNLPDKSGFQSLLTGLTAGGVASFITNPVEVSLVRMQSGKYAYTSVFDAFKNIVRREGVLSLWSGSSATVSRAMVVNALQVGGYDFSKNMFMEHFYIREGVLLHLASSLVAGYVYSFVTLPLDTAKTRMQADRNKYTSMVQTIKIIVEKEGLRSLWNGFIPYFSRCGGHTVFMFLFLEQYRKLADKYYSY
eukprot:snap_masked-scaffold_14-processed-gene-9.30-mRNA-1 protein AED:0.02 eAED:0.02 QI:0/0/0/1/1/1/2/0/288